MSSRNSSINLPLDDFFTKIFNLGYLPRWIIFCIDMAILLLANYLKYLLVSNLSPFTYDAPDVQSRFVIVIGVNMFFFLVYRTYSGIIRHSTFIDGVRLLLSVFSSFVVLLSINYASYFFIGEKIYIIAELAISHLIAFIVLFLFRIFVKFFYESYSPGRSDENLQKVLVYGTDANAISIANALKLDTSSKFKIIGFVDAESKSSSKSMLGLPILTLRKKLPVMIRYIKAEGIIIADKGLAYEEQVNLVDECLEYNYKVFTVPPVLDWEDRKDISRKVKSIQIEDLLDRKPIILDKSAISTQLHGKTIMVTGAAGSIGSEIVRQILTFSPQKLIVLDQAETPLYQLGLEINSIDTKVSVHPVVADIRNKSMMQKIFEQYRPHVVYHAAAYKHVPLMEENPSQAVFTNVQGTKILADLACEYHVKKFVMVSTDKAVNPSNVMGASKRIAEKYVQSLQLKYQKTGEQGTKFITTRFGNVLGSNGSVVPLFTKQIASGGPITITHPDIIRYFMTIPEACQLVLEAGAMGNGGEIYIFDMGKPVKIIDLAKKMIKLAGFTPDKDINIQVVGLRPGEKLYEELLNDASKTLPTHHEKIMIAQEIQEDFNTLFEVIDNLIVEAYAFDNESIVSMMKGIVPEFVSKNSAFELLDK